jgi:hypothetical protein
LAACLPAGWARSLARGSKHVYPNRLRIKIISVTFDGCVPSTRRPGVTTEAVDSEIGLGSLVTERREPGVVGVVEQVSADGEWLVVAWPSGNRDAVRVEDAVAVAVQYGRS